MIRRRIHGKEELVPYKEIRPRANPTDMSELLKGNPSKKPYQYTRNRGRAMDPDQPTRRGPSVQPKIRFRDRLNNKIGTPSPIILKDDPKNKFHLKNENL